VQSWSEWLLDIDVLPAFKDIEIPFWTIPWDTNSAVNVGLTDTNTGTLINYVSGDFQVAVSEERRRQEVVVAILFDPTNRIFRTLAPEKSQANWKFVGSRSYGL